MISTTPRASATPLPRRRRREDRKRPPSRDDRPPVGPEGGVELPHPPRAPPEPASTPVPKEHDPGTDNRRGLRL